MPKVVRADIDNLNTVLTVTVEKKDYEPKFLSELKKYRNQAHLKGFRKGKTPMSVVKKMFGKNALAEIVNEQFQKTLFDYIKEEKLEVLGQPLLADDQEPLDFDLKFLDDYEIQFELGLAPNIEINGLGNSETITRYKIEIADEIIDQDLQNARKRLGTNEQIEEDIQEGDALRLDVRELDENGTIKEDGLDSAFSVLVKDLTDDFKAEFLTKKQGDNVKVNLLNLEQHEMAEEERRNFVRKYYLSLPDDDETFFNAEFEATIEEVNRVTEAELNEEFFKKFLGENTEVTDETGAKDAIREDYDKIYEKQVDSMFYRDTMDRLLELNDFPLPDNFLKKWLKANNGPKIEEKLEVEYDKFAKQTKRSILFTKLKEKFELEAAEEEIVAKAKESVRQMFGQYMGGMQDSFIDQMAMRSLQNEEQVNGFYEQVISDKMINSLKGEVGTVEQVISIEDFQKLLEEAGKSIEDERPVFFDEEE